MTRSRTPGPAEVAKAIGALALVAVAAVVFFAPLPSVDIDLPSLPIPDLPGWLAFALKWAKLAIPAVLVLLVALSQVDVRRGADPEHEEKR